MSIGGAVWGLLTCGAAPKRQSRAREDRGQRASAILFAGLTATVRAQDPLPSWNDGATKTSITAFVEKVTREGSPDFVPVPERIATFDNDGRINLGFSRKLPPDRRAEFEEENVYMDELGVALCPIHRLARQKVVRLRSLAGEPFVQFHRKGARTLFDEVIAVCRRAGFSPRIVNEPDFMATVLTLVESGLCVSIVPRCVASLKRPLVIRSIIPKSAQIPLCVVWRKSSDNPAILAFLEVLRASRPKIRKQMEKLTRQWNEPS